MGIVMVFAFDPTPMTDWYCELHPDSRLCMQINSYTGTDFWLRPYLYRDTAPVPAISFESGDNFIDPNKIVPRPRQHQTKIVP
jgi:hypothetical protein